MELNTRFVPVTLPYGQQVQVEASTPDSLEAARFEPNVFDGVIGAIEGVALAVQNALAKVRPAKASAELGLEVGVEGGQLIALLVKGSGKANLKITLTWE
jgi:hypothetical protein